MKEIIEKGIVAILPEYVKDIGNCTIIYTKDKNKIILNKTIRTILKNICSHYHLDVKAANKTYGEVLSVKRSPPIPFARDNIFINMKVRQPIHKDDGAHGYIKLDEISQIKRSKTSKQNTCVSLKNGLEIEALNKPETINKKIKDGHIIRRLFDNNDSYFVREESLHQGKTTLATKSDLALVYMGLMELKESLEKALNRSTSHL